MRYDEILCHNWIFYEFIPKKSLVGSKIITTHLQVISFKKKGHISYQIRI